MPLHLLLESKLQTRRITKSEPEMFLIPEKYEGVLVILFKQIDGIKEEYFENKRLYNIPLEGILLTKFTKTTPVFRFGTP